MLLPNAGNPDPALLFPVPKLKPEVAEFVESSDLAPKVNPVEGVFSAALPKVNPVVVLVLASDDPNPKNPEAKNKKDTFILKFSRRSKHSIYNPLVLNFLTLQ